MSATEQKYGTIITDMGVNAVFVATTEGVRVNIDTLAAGDGDGEYYFPTTDMEDLKNEKWRGAIGSYKVNENSPNMITVRAVIPATVGGFTIRELALFSDTGVMIAVANTPDIEKVVMEDGIFGTLEVSLSIVLTNAGTLNFVVDSSTITATAEDLENHNDDPNAHPGLLEQLGSLGNTTTVSATMPEDMQAGDTWWKIPDTGMDDDYNTEPEEEVLPEPDPEPDPDDGKEVMALDLVEEEMPLNVSIDGELQGISNAEENTEFQTPLTIFNILN